jgi:hypothetical protein
MAKPKIVAKTTAKTSGKSTSASAPIQSQPVEARATAPNLIRVPRPLRTSFNPERLVAKNTLIKNQIEHFHKVELDLPPEQRTGVDFENIRTEGQASEYIQKMTAILHPKVAKTGGR